MDILCTIIDLLLLMSFMWTPVIIANFLRKNHHKNQLIKYVVGSLTALGLLSVAWPYWNYKSNQMLLSHYGYNEDGLNETEFYRNVKPENVPIVKEIIVSESGLGWPEKSFFIFQASILYMPFPYLVTKFRMRKKT